MNNEQKTVEHNTVRFAVGTRISFYFHRRVEHPLTESRFSLKRAAGRLVLVAVPAWISFAVLSTDTGLFERAEAAWRDIEPFILGLLAVLEKLA